MTTEQEELLRCELVDAWLEYLHDTREARANGRYDDAERWAWARLQQRRRAISRRARKLGVAEREPVTA